MKLPEKISEDKRIEVSYKHEWGKKRYYPENALAHKFIELLSIGKASQKRLCFSEETVSKLKEIGYVFVTVSQEL